MYQFSTFIDNVYIFNEDNSIPPLPLIVRIILMTTKARC